MEKICIHDYERRYENSLKWLSKNKKVSDKNKEIVLRFCEKQLLNGMSKARITKYMSFFSLLFKIFDKDLDKATKEDIEKIVATVNARKDFSPFTKHDCKVLLKRFYKWLLGNDEEYPSQVKWLKSSVKRNEQKLPSEGDLITPEDVNKLIAASTSPRDKAFVSLLYESGCRIGEIGSMRIGNVSFDKYGTVITVSGKTGSRKLRVVNATPSLMNWLNVHPFKNDKDKPLWLNLWLRNHYQAQAYSSFKVMLKRLFKKAGINKRCNPHLFRHSRATYLANYLTEFQMNQYFGWIQGSDMPATYVHMSGREVDNTILEISGIKSRETEQRNKPETKICPRCDSLNNSDSTYCRKCSFVLDEKEAVKLETEKREEEQMTELAKKILDKLAQRLPEVKDIIAEEMKNLK